MMNPALLKKHMDQLKQLPPRTRYQGYDMKQLLKDNLIRFEPAVLAARCGECGNPLSQPYCAVTGQPHDQKAAGSMDLNVEHFGDIFDGIFEPSSLPDFTYDAPAANVPGYRAKLHEDVLRQAKVFLADFFDDDADRLRAIEQDARTCVEKYQELLHLNSALFQTQKMFSHHAEKTKAGNAM